MTTVAGSAKRTNTAHSLASFILNKLVAESYFFHLGADAIDVLADKRLA